MEIFSELTAFCAGTSPVPGEFPSQRPVTRSFDVSFDPRLNKRLCKQSWFETLSRPLWRRCNELTMSTLELTLITIHPNDTQLWQARDWMIRKTISRSSYWLYHWLEPPNLGLNKSWLFIKFCSRCIAGNISVCGKLYSPMQRRHNERDGVSNNRRHDCLFNRVFRPRSKKTSKLCVTGLCEGKSPVTGEFHAQRASNAEFFFHLMTSSCSGSRWPIRIIQCWAKTHRDQIDTLDVSGSLTIAGNEHQ